MKLTVGAPHEHVETRAAPDAVDRAATAWRACDLLPLDPTLAVPVAIPDLAVFVDGEDFGLGGLAPRRSGGSGAERAAEGQPVRPCYLMSPCFFSHAAATALLSALSTATCLFMSFSSPCVSFALIEFRRRLIVPSSF